MDKEVKELARVARAQGWRVEYRSRHVFFYPPDKTRGHVTAQVTGSDWRGIRNLRAQLRRAGLVI